MTGMPTFGLRLPNDPEPQPPAAVEGQHCQASIRPPTAADDGRCGQPATHRIADRFYCPEHGSIAHAQQPHESA